MPWPLGHEVYAECDADKLELMINPLALYLCILLYHWFVHCFPLVLSQRLEDFKSANKPKRKQCPENALQFETHCIIFFSWWTNFLVSSNKLQHGPVLCYLFLSPHLRTWITLCHLPKRFWFMLHEHELVSVGKHWIRMTGPRQVLVKFQ